MANTIQVRRGSEISLPILSSGEFGFTTDSIRLFMGDSIVNHEIAFFRDLPESLVEIDATNISNVIFTLSNGDTITKSFAHVHTNYALASKLYFEFDCGTPESVWHITHNLSYMPSSTVMDTAGTVVEGEVNHISVNELTITFSAPFSGKAYLS